MGNKAHPSIPTHPTVLPTLGGRPGHISSPFVSYGAHQPFLLSGRQKTLQIFGWASFWFPDASSKSDGKKRVESHSTGWGDKTHWQEEITHQTSWGWALSWWRNGGGLEMLSWSLTLQPCIAHVDQECWVCGCPKDLVLPRHCIFTRVALVWALFLSSFTSKSDYCIHGAQDGWLILVEQ